MSCAHPPPETLQAIFCRGCGAFKREGEPLVYLTDPEAFNAALVAVLKDIPKGTTVEVVGTELT